MAAPQVRVESKVYVVPGRARPPAGSWWRRKGAVILLIGIVLLAGGALGLVSGLAIMLTGNELTPGSGLLVAGFCGALGVFPGIILFAYGWMQRKHAKLLEEFAALLESYRRVNPRDMASQLGLPLTEVQRLFQEAAGLGIVRAYVDRATGEYVLYVASTMEQFVDACPGCGNKIQKWVFPDDTFRCPYCGTDIGTAARKRPPDAPPPA